MIPSSSVVGGMLICEVCGNEARSSNYGAMSCDACKMFFRRYSLQQARFYCQIDGLCHINRRRRPCAPCRFDKCMSCGMRMDSSQIREVQNVRDAWKIKLLNRLLSDDEAREKQYLGQFTYDDPTIAEIVRNGCRLTAKDPTYEMRIVDWCFTNALTGIKFLENLRFMRHIDNNDRILLLKSFYIKSSLMFWAFRMYQIQHESLQTPDGEDIYPELVCQMMSFNPATVNGMRNKPVAIFRDLQVTKEEMVFLLVTLFCDPVLENLSPNGQNVVAHHQKLYNSVLYHYCQVNYNDSAPTRLTNLSSITHSLNRSKAEVEIVCMMSRVHCPDYKVQKLTCNEAWYKLFSAFYNCN